MEIVFSRIIYDSKLLHSYVENVDTVTQDVNLKSYSPHEFTAVLPVAYDQYNYIYIPEYERYFYMTVTSYKNNNIEVTFTCDYGRTFYTSIYDDFYILVQELSGVNYAKLSNGDHIYNENSIVYLPDAESVTYIDKSDVDHILELFNKGVIINFDI